MGIFDFFKKIKKQEEDIKRIRFEEIAREINNEKQKIENYQKEPKNQIKESLSELLQGLERGVISLKEVSLEEKKAPERAKLIVRENLIKFNDYLGKLISNLKELNSESLETLINKINLIFHEFEQKSSKSFEKSTFLIGKELGEIRENIKKFYRIFNKIIKENEQTIEQGKRILIIEEKLQIFNEINKNILNNEGGIREIEKTIKIGEEKIQNLKKEIEEKKKSSEYIKRIRTIQEIEKLKISLALKLQELKNLIDFKALTKIYHSIESKMRLIKEYKENFKETFEKHGCENLQELVDIRDINQELINEKIKEIKEIKQNIENIQIEEDITGGLVKNIKDIERNIEDFNFEKIGKQKRDKRLREDKNKAKEEIIIELIKIGIIVKD
jgi:hypothetical protein